VDNGENLRLFVDFVEYYTPGVIGGDNKLNTHALKGKPNLSKITTAVGRHAILCLIASKSTLIYSRCRR